LRDRAVTNSTCLIALERIDKLDLLPKLFTTVFAPPAVQDELGCAFDWLQVRTPADPGAVAALRTQLHAGEAETIALAMELQDVSIILDDGKARRIAAQLELDVIGTLGVLIAAKTRGFIESVGGVIESLDQAGFRMSAELRAEALQLAGESHAIG